MENYILKRSNISRYFILVTLLLFSITTLSVGLLATSAEEEIDLMSLNLMRISTRFNMTQSNYFTRLDQTSLDQTCDRQKNLQNCYARIDRSQNIVTFSAVTEPRLLANDLVFNDKDEVAITFLFYYVPYQFSFLPGINVPLRSLKMAFPTHITLFEKVTHQPHISKFTIEKAPESAELNDVKSSYKQGENIIITGIDGNICVGAILNKKKEAHTLKTSIGCKPFTLPTRDIPPNAYTVSVISITPKSMIHYSQTTAVLESEHDIIVDVVPPKVVAGDIFFVDALDNEYNPIHLKDCTITLEDVFNNVIDKVTDKNCSRVPIGTPSTLTGGEYIVRISAFKGDKEVSGETTIEATQNKGSAGEIQIGKSEFYAGEHLEFNLKANGDYCTVELLDSGYGHIKQLDAMECSNGDLKLDETLSEGLYTIKTRVYKKNKKVGFMSRTIHINKWTFKPKSDFSRLCTSGEAQIGEDAFPCISEGYSCIPSSDAVPLCLCFDKEGAINDFCKFNEKCNSAGCQESPLSSPYTIIQKNNKCIARRGVQNIECVFEGELCSGGCICVVEDYTPVATCAVGEICTKGGCITPELVFELEKIEPNHIEAGKSTDIKILGQIKLKEGKLNQGDPNLDFKAFIGNEEGTLSSKLFSGGDNFWEVTMEFPAITPPRNSELLFVTQYNDFTHAVRKDFDIWYPANEQKLNVHIKEVLPDKISLKHLKSGASIKIRAHITDSGDDVIKALPQNAIRVTLGEAKSYSLSAVFDRLTNDWTIVANFQNDSPLFNAEEIKLEISHLGRKGSATYPVKTLQKLPLSLQIGFLNPGNEEKPLFYMLVPIGFSLDVFLNIEGDANIKKEHFKIFIGETDVTEYLSYVTSTNRGLKLHLSNVVLCPNPPRPNTNAQLKVTLNYEDQSISDFAFLYIKGNPGNWKNLSEAKCNG